MIKANEMVCLVVEQLIKQYLIIWRQQIPAIQQKIKDMLTISKIKLEVPKTAMRQALKDNVEHTSIEEYYRSYICLPFFESLLHQLKHHFQGKTKDATKGDVFDTM